jgi:hypothetical protein
MIIPGQNVKIVIATKPVDFRKGHEGLAAVAQNELGLCMLNIDLMVNHRVDCAAIAAIPLCSPIAESMRGASFLILPKKSGSQIANEGLKQIAELYRIEGPSQITPAASGGAPGRSAPILKSFGIWLKQQRARVSFKSRIGEKLACIGNQWDDLQLFLTDGRVEIDSNAVENTIRPIALNRKNALLTGRDEGGKS